MILKKKADCDKYVSVGVQCRYEISFQLKSEESKWKTIIKR